MSEFDYSKMDKRPSQIRRSFQKGLTAFVVVAACILFYFLLLHISSIWGVVKRFFEILAPVWFGFAFAYLLNPLMKRIEKLVIKWTSDSKMKDKTRKKMARVIGVVISILVLIAIIVVLINLLIPELSKSISKMIRMLPREISAVTKWTESIDTSTTLGLTTVTVINKIIGFVEEWLKGDFLSSLNTVASSVYLGIVSTVKGVINFVIGIVLAIYMLLDKERFMCQGKKLLYSISRKQRGNFILHIARKCDRMFGGFLIGKSIDSLIIGVICFICMSIFKFSENYTLLISVIVGVTNIVPFFGPFVGAVPSAILLLLENPLHCLYFLIFIILLQQFDGNVLSPAILGESTGLNAFWIIIAILLGGGFFGFLGMLLGVPAFGVIYYLIDMMISDKLRRKGLPTESEKYTDATFISDDNEIFEQSPEAEADEEIRETFSMFRKLRLVFSHSHNNEAEEDDETEYDDADRDDTDEYDQMNKSEEGDK